MRSCDVLWCGGLEGTGVGGLEGWGASWNFGVNELGGARWKIERKGGMSA